MQVFLGGIFTTSQSHSTGTVEEVLPNALYAIRLVDGRRLIAALGSTARHRLSRLIAGDRVKIRPASHDQNRGQIIAKL